MIKKSYSELLFTDDYMFWTVMSLHPDLCKELLELILGIRIKYINTQEIQKTVEVTYDGRGIRLDVYVDDDAGTVYDLEMQTTIKKDLPKRTRYYQGMIDLHLIQRKSMFSELKKSYVIFICTDDPFGKRLPVYTFKNICLQDRSIELGDEAIKVIINPNSNRDGLSEEMNSFLDLLQNKEELSGLAQRISDAVDDAKLHKTTEAGYMTLQMMINEEKDEWLAEGREKGLVEGRAKEIFDSVSEGDYSVSRGAQKMNLTEEEFIKQMEAAGYKVPCDV